MRGDLAIALEIALRQTEAALDHIITRRTLNEAAVDVASRCEESATGIRFEDIRKLLAETEDALAPAMSTIGLIALLTA